MFQSTHLQHKFQAVLLSVAICVACSTPDEPQGHTAPPTPGRKAPKGPLSLGQSGWNAQIRRQIREHIASEHSTPPPNDVWGTPLKIVSSNVSSAGADRTWNTSDDVNLNLDDFKWEELPPTVPPRIDAHDEPTSVR